MEQAPQDARLPYNMGIAASSDGEVEAARFWLSRAAQLDPQWPAPQQQLAALPRSRP